MDAGGRGRDAMYYIFFCEAYIYVIVCIPTLFRLCFRISVKFRCKSAVDAGGGVIKYGPTAVDSTSVWCSGLDGLQVVEGNEALSVRRREGVLFRCCLRAARWTTVVEAGFSAVSMIRSWASAARSG